MPCELVADGGPAGTFVAGRRGWCEPDALGGPCELPAEGVPAAAFVVGGGACCAPEAPGRVDVDRGIE